MCILLVLATAAVLVGAVVIVVVAVVAAAAVVWPGQIWELKSSHSHNSSSYNLYTMSQN